PRRTVRLLTVGLRAPGRNDVRELGPLALLGLLLGRADIDEACNALVLGETKGFAHALAVAVPLRDPLRAVAEGGRGEDQVLAGGARREHLLPFGRRRVLDDA